MTDGQKYGWTCAAYDDERSESPFDSVEDALAEAATRVEEDMELDPGTHEFEVEVFRVAPFRVFDPTRVTDDVIERVEEEGFEGADEWLELHRPAFREELEAALQAVWDAHVARHSVATLYESLERGKTHTVSVTIEADEP